MSEECETYQNRTGATTMITTGMLTFDGARRPVGAHSARRSTGDWPWTSLVVIAALLALGLLTWVFGARYRPESDVSRIQREDENTQLLREVHRAVLGHGLVSAQVVEYAAASVGATGPAGPPRGNANAVVSLKGFAGSRRSGGTSGHLDIHGGVGTVTPIARVALDRGPEDGEV